jgi:hypothetical protein
MPIVRAWLVECAPLDLIVVYVRWPLSAHEINEIILQLWAAGSWVGKEEFVPGEQLKLLPPEGSGNNLWLWRLTSREALALARGLQTI